MADKKPYMYRDDEEWDYPEPSPLAGMFHFKLAFAAGGLLLILFVGLIGLIWKADLPLFWTDTQRIVFGLLMLSSTLAMFNPVRRLWNPFKAAPLRLQPLRWLHPALGTQHGTDRCFAILTAGCCLILVLFWIVGP